MPVSRRETGGQDWAQLRPPSFGGETSAQKYIRRLAFLIPTPPKKYIRRGRTLPYPNLWASADPLPWGSSGAIAHPPVWGSCGAIAHPQPWGSSGAIAHPQPRAPIHQPIPNLWLATPLMAQEQPISHTGWSPYPTYGSAWLGTDQFPKTQAPKISIFKIQKLKNGQLTLGAQNSKFSKTQKWATDPKWAQIWGVLFCTPTF